MLSWYIRISRPSCAPFYVFRSPFCFQSASYCFNASSASPFHHCICRIASLRHAGALKPAHTHPLHLSCCSSSTSASFPSFSFSSSNYLFDRHQVVIILFLEVSQSRFPPFYFMSQFIFRPLRQVASHSPSLLSVSNAALLLIFRRYLPVFFLIDFGPVFFRLSPTHLFPSHQIPLPKSSHFVASLLSLLVVFISFVPSSNS